MAFASTAHLSAARSLLFVPAHRADRYAKALASGADLVIVDLEDAVSPDAKDTARQLLEAALPALPDADRARLLVRINAEATPWHEADLALLAALAPLGLAGMMVPKVEGAPLLAHISAACPGVALLPQIESGAGLDALTDIAVAPGVARLCLGHLDLQNDLGIDCGPAQSELAPARWDIVRASRRQGLPQPVDSVTTDIADPAVIDGDAARARREGFGAKLCIHPAQVARVHAAFEPTSEQQHWARRVLDAVTASRGAACTVDGRMVDAPVILAARRMLARLTAPA